MEWRSGIQIMPVMIERGPVVLKVGSSVVGYVAVLGENGEELEGLEVLEGRGREGRDGRIGKGVLEGLGGMC